jgi:hypothetical protein
VTYPIRVDLPIFYASSLTRRLHSLARPVPSFITHHTTLAMADSEQQTPITEMPFDDVEMGDSAAGAGEETGLTELEPEAPKLVLFAEYVTTFS